VAAVVEEERVPGPGVPDKALELLPDVGPRGRRRGRVGVGEDADVGFVEPEALHEAAAHARHVVEAALQLVVPARVVEAGDALVLPRVVIEVVRWWRPEWNSIGLVRAATSCRLAFLWRRSGSSCRVGGDRVPVPSCEVQSSFLPRYFLFVGDADEGHRVRVHSYVACSSRGE